MAHFFYALFFGKQLLKNRFSVSSARHVMATFLFLVFLKDDLEALGYNTIYFKQLQQKGNAFAIHHAISFSIH